jgi:hypothetical protein
MNAERETFDDGVEWIDALRIRNARHRTDAEPVGEGGVAIAVYSPVEAGLAALRSRYANAVFDVGSTKGLQEAREARAALRTTRVDLEARRVAEKREALEYGRLVDAEARRIRLEIEALETPIDAQIKAEEERREAAREEKAARERQRVADIQERIGAIRDLALATLRFSPEEARKALVAAEAPIDPALFEEFAAEAEAVRARTVEQLRAGIVAIEEEAAAREARERARIEAEAEATAALAAAQEATRQAEQVAAEAERAAHAAREEAKAEALARDFIASVKSAPARMVGESLAALRAERERVEAIQLDAGPCWTSEEWRNALAAAQQEAILRLRALEAIAERAAQQEAQQAREAKERAEAARTAQEAALAAERERRLIAAKCDTQNTALRAIIKVCESENDYTDLEARAEAALIARANAT